MASTQHDITLRELWSHIVRYVRANFKRTVLMSLLSFVAGWLLNVYVLAVRYEGSAVAPGVAATAPGNYLQGGMYWGVLTTIVFSLFAYGHSAGWGKLRDDLLSLPGILKETFAPPAEPAWSMLLWGAAVSLAAAVVVGPAVAGILGVGLLLMAPSPISAILGRVITRLWIGVLGAVSPASKHRVGGLGGTIAGVAGTALGMVLAWRAGSGGTKLVLALVAAVAAYLLITRKATPEATVAFFMLAGGIVLLTEIFEGVALADDGGWTECGDCSVIDWVGSPGADQVIRSGAVGGVASGAGAALGTGLGSAVAGLDGGGYGGGDGIPERPQGPPPGGDEIPDRPEVAPPLLDERGEVMEVSDGSGVGPDGQPIPPGLVRWDVPGEETRWVSRDEAIDLVQEVRDAAATQEQFDREVAARADANEAESRAGAAARREAEEAQAAERLAERERLEEWGERLDERDALVRRQELLEADSARKNTDEGWWDSFYDEYQRGVQEDVSALPHELGQMAHDAIAAAHREVTDGENWRVLGETLRDSAVDALRVAVGDRDKTQEVAANLRAGIERTAEVAGTLYAAAENDPEGALIGTARAVLGADNWERALDKDTPVGERFVRSVWGAFDTGGVLLGGGQAALQAADKVGDMIRGADRAGDAVRAADAFGDAARAGDAASDALRAADATSDTLRGADAGTDAARAADASGDAARAGRLTPEEIARIERAEDATRAQRGVGRTADAPDAPRGPYQDPDATRAALDDLSRPLDEFGDEAAQAAERARRQQQIFDPAAPGTTPDDYIRNLPEGAIIDQNLVHHTGYTGEQIDGLRTVAREHNVVSGTRLTNAESMRHVRDGTGIPKPVEVKTKTIGELDTYLGADPADRGLVGLFEPKRTPEEAYQAARESLEAAGREIPDDLMDQIAKRHDLRSGEYANMADHLAAGDDIAIDLNRGVVTDKYGTPYAGDIDPVFFRDATTGKYLSGDEYLKVLETYKNSGVAGQHGAEVNLLGDLTRGMEPGSDEWHRAYDKALELQKKLGQSHIDGSELVVEMGPDGILRRGTVMSEGLPDVEKVTGLLGGSS